MALRWADFPTGDVGLYGTNKTFMLNGIWAAVNNFANIVEDPDPNVTGNVFQANILGANTVQVARKVLPVPVTTIGLASRIWMSSLPSSTDMWPSAWACSDPSNNSQVAVTVSPTGGFIVLGGNSVIYTNSTPYLVANAWQHVEVKIVISATVGSVTIQVEGVEVVNATGLNTTGNGGTTSQNAVIWNRNNGTGVGIGWYIKDYVVWDGSGSLDNDFFGTVQVTRMTTNSDVSLNWAPSSGSTGWNLINESPPVDTSYISAEDDPIPSPSIMTLTDLPEDVSSVRGLITVIRATKTDGGDGNLQTSLISGVDTVDGADRPITTAATYWYDVFETDPATDAPWSPDAVNDVQIKFNRTV